MKEKGMIGMLAVILLGLAACQNRHAGGRETLRFSDLTARFPSFTLPFSYNEDSLSSDLPDSTRLAYKETAVFIPDSLWHPGGRQKTEARIYPLGKKQYGDLELLLVRTVSGKADEVFLLVYNQADTLAAVQPLMGKQASSSRRSFEIDKNYLLHLNIRKNLSNGEVIRKEDVYAVNGDGSIALIMTNTNQPANPNNFYNPIDTFPRKNHYSGDYFAGKSDMVSIRDGDREGTFRFFIHLNKNKGDCTGELDGTGKFERPATGIYKDQDGPCGIRFDFSSSKVTLSEVGGCGAYRGISCNFTGSYTKQKTSQSKK